MGSGTATLGKDAAIAGTQMDMVILGQPWRDKSSVPLTTWDLNSHHLVVSALIGNTTVCIQVCAAVWLYVQNVFSSFQDVHMKNGMGGRYGGAIQIIGGEQTRTTLLLQDMVLSENSAPVPSSRPFCFELFIQRISTGH